MTNVKIVTFAPVASANNVRQALGDSGAGQIGEEERIEVVCERSKAKAVIEAMKEAHPYEEAAFDIYALLSEDEL